MSRLHIPHHHKHHAASGASPGPRGHVHHTWPVWQPAEDFTYYLSKVLTSVRVSESMSALLMLIDLPNHYCECTMKQKDQNSSQTNM